MTCSICETPKAQSRFAFDMLGCTHTLCIDCFFKVQSPPPSPPMEEDNDISCSSIPDSDDEVTKPCPIPGCQHGFFMYNRSIVATALNLDIIDDECQCSSNMIYCNICMESKSISECFMDAKGCNHVFCSNCIAHYVAAKIEDNIVSIKCPDIACTDGVLELEACRPILDHKVYMRWGTSLCVSSIAEPMKLYCPFKDCSALVLNDENVKDTECPHCSRMFCANCNVPWHEGIACEDYQRLGDREKGEDDLMLLKMAKKRQWQRCPKCGIFVERVDGCVFITCRCKHNFCYICASAMDKNDMKHYCSKCKCTWDAKPKSHQQ